VLLASGARRPARAACTHLRGNRALRRGDADVAQGLARHLLLLPWWRAAVRVGWRRRRPEGDVAIRLLLRWFSRLSRPRRGEGKRRERDVRNLVLLARNRGDGCDAAGVFDQGVPLAGADAETTHDHIADQRGTQRDQRGAL
jgi:hypothetical protein